MSLSENTIIVTKNRAMGDAVIGLGGLQYARELFPDKKLVYAIPDWICPLFADVDIVADEVVPVRLKSIGDWFSMWKTMKNISPELVFEFFQSGRTGKFFNLYSKLSKSDYFFHNHHPGIQSKIYDQGVIKSNIQRDLDGLYSYWGKDYPKDLSYEPKMTLRREVEKENAIILGVVATRKTKMWPLENYVELAKKLSEKGIKCLIPIAPSELDQDIKKSLNSLRMDKFADYIEVSLTKLPYELSRAKMYIGNDTGMKHICVALGIPTHTFFGPEPPTEWHPYNLERHSYDFIDDLECRTRTAHFCGLSECDSMICLNQINDSQVLARVTNFF